MGVWGFLGREEGIMGPLGMWRGIKGFPGVRGYRAFKRIRGDMRGDFE